MVTIREVTDGGLSERVTAAESKFQQVDSRLASLEEMQKQEGLALENQQVTLWALSKGRACKLLHVVKQASWNLPLQDWSPSCGWKFAKRNVKVELTRRPNESTRRCGKCQELEQLRDEVSGGVGLAQLVEI